MRVGAGKNALWLYGHWISLCPFSVLHQPDHSRFHPMSRTTKRNWISSYCYSNAGYACRRKIMRQLETVNETVPDVPFYCWDNAHIILINKNFSGKVGSRRLQLSRIFTVAVSSFCSYSDYFEALFHPGRARGLRCSPMNQQGGRSALDSLGNGGSWEWESLLPLILEVRFVLLVWTGNNQKMESTVEIERRPYHRGRKRNHVAVQNRMFAGTLSRFHGWNNRLIWEKSG